MVISFKGQTKIIDRLVVDTGAAHRVRDQLSEGKTHRGAAVKRTLLQVQGGKESLVKKMKHKRNTEAVVAYTKKKRKTH